MIKTKVERAVDVPALIKASLGDAMSEAMFAVHSAVTNRSPLDTGNLVGSLSPGAGVTEVAGDGMSARVGTNVDYGRILNESKRTHYRQHKSYAGQETASWFNEGVGEADLSGAPQTLTAAIENGWKTRRD